MTAADEDPAVFDQLVETSGEGSEPGQPDVPQDPAWQPAGALLTVT